MCFYYYWTEHCHLIVICIEFFMKTASGKALQTADHKAELANKCTGSKESKHSFGGLKKGFLFTDKPKTSKPVTLKIADDIPYIKSNKQAISNQYQFSEVQQAMSSLSEHKGNYILGMCTICCQLNAVVAILGETQLHWFPVKYYQLAVAKLFF